MNYGELFSTAGEEREQGTWEALPADPFAVLTHMNSEPEDEPPQILAGKVDEDLKCSICLELFKDPLITNCGHTFCSRCVYQVQPPV